MPLIAAWHRPDALGRVLAFSAGLPQLTGGRMFKDLAATTPPLRALLRAAATLLEHGHDARLVLVEDGYGSKRAGVLLPEALRWLWRV